jgi:hypothetical protein
MVVGVGQASPAMIGAGLIGFGHWGPNVARNLVAEGARLVAVSDISAARRSAARARYPAAHNPRQWRALVDNPAINRHPGDHPLCDCRSVPQGGQACPRRKADDDHQP